MRYSKDVSDLIAARREYVTDMAFKLFAEKDIDSVSMNDVAKFYGFGVASVYRYFGTKTELVLAVGTKKWSEYYSIIQREYKKRDGKNMTAAEELEFYIESYILLYNKYRDILRFNMYFDAYIVSEDVSAEKLEDYYSAVDLFAAKFHVVYKKAKADGTVRTDVPEHEMFSIIMHTMLLAASKYACGLVYPANKEFSRINALNRIKMMLLNYYCV